MSTVNNLINMACCQFLASGGSEYRLVLCDQGAFLHSHSVCVCAEELQVILCQHNGPMGPDVLCWAT